MAEKNRKTRVGRVVSDKMEKTVVVAVRTTKTHPLYKKLLRRTTKFMAHDEGSLAHVGDVVRIVEARPMSKMKHWRLVEVLESKVQPSPVAEVATADVAAEILEPKVTAAAEAQAEAESAQAESSGEPAEEAVSEEVEGA